MTLQNKNAKNRCNKLVRKAKQNLFQTKINENINNPKKLWSSLQSLGVISSAHSSSAEISANELNNYFVSFNNGSVNQEIINQEICQVLETAIYPSFILQHVSLSDVAKAAKTIKTNAEGVDKINKRMLDECMPHCLDVLTHTINFSFSSNTFPQLWKMANVCPNPKVTSPKCPKDYRPISLLPTLSKVIERLVSFQVCKYLDNHNLFNSYQSGFRPLHSTGTALLDICNHLLDALDNGKVSVLTLLDFSKAFDTINHDLLLAKLKSLGFMSSSILWFQSYLSYRQQRVVFENSVSEWHPILNGVPQGSILGPVLFIIMTHNISDAITSSNFHLYADDTQLYNSCTLESLPQTITNLNNDLSSVAEWSSRNALKLNSSKCEYIIIGSPSLLKKVDNMVLPSVSINNVPLPRVNKCKNLGVIFDPSFSWTFHINSLISKAYFKLKCLYRFKNLLSTNVKLKLCDSLILSLFNYCDYIYFNISGILKQKIQRVQNSCIRFSYSLKKFDHISSSFTKSGWLGMNYRRTIHGLCMVYKILNRLVPPYTILPISQITTTHQYSTRHDFLPIPRSRTAVKSMSFYCACVDSYNSLPDTIKSSGSLYSFKHHLNKYFMEMQNS